MAAAVGIAPTAPGPGSSRIGRGSSAATGCGDDAGPRAVALGLFLLETVDHPAQLTEQVSGHRILGRLNLRHPSGDGASPFQPSQHGRWAAMLDLLGDRQGRQVYAVRGAGDLQVETAELGLMFGELRHALDRLPRPAAVWPRA